MMRLLLGGLGALVFGVAAHAQCEVAQLQGETGVDSDFGRSVAIFGDRAVIGDGFPCFDLSCTGAAYVFRLVGGVWTEEAVIHSPDPDPEVEFANPIALGDGIILAGAENTDAPEFDSGAVWVFRYDITRKGWFEEAMLVASDGGFSDNLGHAVSVDGNLALVGATGDDTAGQPNAGSAYVFRFDGSSWIEEAKLTDPRPAAQDRAGAAVAIRGDTALVGSPGSLVTGANESVLIFRFNGLTWVLEAELTVGPLGDQRQFGGSVALGQDVALIGAYRDDSDAGAAYVFRFDGSSWRMEQKLTVPVADGTPPRSFGRSVSLDPSGTTAVIGAPEDGTLGFQAGAAHVFRFDGSRWSEVAMITATNGGPAQIFGRAVAAGDDVVLIGAPQGGAAGWAYVVAGTNGMDCNLNGAADACDIFDGTSGDENSNGVPDDCEASGDLNGDGVVGINDFLLMLASWGLCDAPCPPSCSGDLDANCVVDGLDFLLLLNNWG